MSSATKNKRIYIRLTEKDYDLLRKIVEDNGFQTMSAYVLGCIHEKKVPDIDRKALRELTHQLYKTGTNLNQLTRLANTQGIIVKELDDVLQEVKDTVNRINELI